MKPVGLGKLAELAELAELEELAALVKLNLLKPAQSVKLQNPVKPEV